MQDCLYSLHTITLVLHGVSFLFHLLISCICNVLFLNFMLFLHYNLWYTHVFNHFFPPSCAIFVSFVCLILLPFAISMKCFIRCENDQVCSHVCCLRLFILFGSSFMSYTYEDLAQNSLHLFYRGVCRCFFAIDDSYRWFIGIFCRCSFSIHFLIDNCLLNMKLEYLTDFFSRNYSD